MTAVVAQFLRPGDPLGAAPPFLDDLPVAVMLCEPHSSVICYANRRSMELLKSIEHVLPVPAHAVVGSSIDIFHKTPARQRALLADPAHLPHRALITAGDELLDLQINAVRDARGLYRYAQLTWAVVTQDVERERKNQRLLQMVEEMPINVMTCTLDDFRIDYANRASRETMRRIEQHVPVKADQLVGTPIDVFHKNPAHQRQMLATPAHLPHEARIHVGPEVLDLRVSAILGQDGAYLGPMVTWSIVTSDVKLAAGVTEVVGAMRETSDEMQQASARLLELSEGTDRSASAVSAAAAEMSASFDEFSGRIMQMNGMSQSMAEKAGSASGAVVGLSESVERIGKVSILIDKIAGQTNLLALNATIEAARVGEFGRGFAVVAQEVKALAEQTANATKDIRQLVASVQANGNQASAAVSDISDGARQLSEVFTALSAGVEQQVSTNRAVSEMIAGVSDATGEIRAAADTVRHLADQVSDHSARLSGEVASLIRR